MTQDRNEGGWASRAPASVLEYDLCARGHTDPTPQDRRWLRRLESYLAVFGTNDGQRSMGRDLQQYLHETCEHNWHGSKAEADIPAHRQCSWCSAVEWAAGAAVEE